MMTGSLLLPEVTWMYDEIDISDRDAVNLRTSSVCVEGSGGLDQKGVHCNVVMYIEAYDI